MKIHTMSNNQKKGRYLNRQSIRVTFRYSLYEHSYKNIIILAKTLNFCLTFRKIFIAIIASRIKTIPFKHYRHPKNVPKNNKNKSPVFFDPFHPPGLFLYPLFLYLWFSKVFRGYKKRPMA